MSISSLSQTLTRLLIGSASICLVLVVSGAFVSSPVRGRAVMTPGDGIPGTPEASPGAMGDYLQQIDFGAGSDPSGIFDGSLPCGMPAKCGGKTSVHLRIVPSNFATNADWDNALNKGNGYVVAKVSNLDVVPYDRLNLGPNEIGYVWVGDSQGLGRTAALYAIRGGTVKRLFNFKGHGFCRNSAAQKPAVHIYTPAMCTDPTPKAAAAAPEQASIEPFTAIAAYVVKTVTRRFSPPPGVSGLWISCSAGCCEAQF